MHSAQLKALALLLAPFLATAQLDGLLSSAENAVGGAVSTAVESAVQGQASDLVPSGLNSIADAATSEIANIGSAISDPGVASVFSDLATASISFPTEPAFVSSVQAFVSSKDVSGAVSAVSDALGSAVGSAFTAIETGASGVAGSASAAFGSAVTAVETGASGAAGAASSAAGNLVSDAQGAASSVAAGASSLATSASSRAAGADSAASSATQAAATGGVGSQPTAAIMGVGAAMAGILGVAAWL